MAGIQYIEVPIKEGLTVQVRVISQHPDDKELRKRLTQASNLWSWTDDQMEAVKKETDPLKAQARIAILADVAEVRNECRYKVVEAALADKLSGTEISEVIRQCNDQSFLDIFYAAQGQDPKETALDRIRKLAALYQIPPEQLSALSLLPPTQSS